MGKIPENGKGTSIVQKAVLITGAAGFIGSYLANEAIAAGYSLIGVDYQLPREPEIWSRFTVSYCESAALDSLCSGFDVQHVFHLAGASSVPLSVTDPLTDFQSLLPGVAAVAQFCRSAGTHMIFFSSAAVYGNPARLPINETELCLPVSPYGIHKRSAEVLLEHYSRIWSIPITVLRIFSVYGPGLRRQLFWDLAKSAMLSKQEGREHVTLFGIGTETRDFINVTDVVRATMCLANAKEGARFEIFNIASGVAIEISHAAKCLLSGLQFSIDLRFNGSVREGDPHHWCADVSKLKQIGFKTFISFDEGVSSYANWFMRQNL